MKRLLLITIALLTISFSVMAQVTTSGITGVVMADGEEAIGATITAKHVPSGSVYRAVTNIDGHYTITGMKAGGPYEVEVSYIGFQTAKFADIQLALGQNAVVDASLSEGSEMIQEIVVTAKAKDGKLRISFPEVKAGQAVICGIAIATVSPVATQSQQTVNAIPTSWRAFDTDTIAKLPKELLPKDTEARPASVYEPAANSQKTKAGSGTSFVIKPGLGQEYALRFRYKNTTGNPVKARMTITDSKRTTLVDRDITFPPTPNKFKMLSTTTGTQINAGTYTVCIDTKDVEFKELEIQ